MRNILALLAAGGVATTLAISCGSGPAETSSSSHFGGNGTSSDTCGGGTASVCGGSGPK